MFKDPKLKRRICSTSGMTLVEVMVAATILTVAGIGTLTGLLQARRLTEGSIYVATATTVAQGYIEQIKNMEFNLLDEPVIPELISQGQDDSLAVSAMPSDPETGDSSTDRINTRSIDINNTPDEAQDDLDIDFVIYIEDLTDEANGIGDARRVILRWSYVDNTTGTDVPVGNTLYAIRSRVPTY